MAVRTAGAVAPLRGAAGQRDALGLIVHAAAALCYR